MADSAEVAGRLTSLVRSVLQRLLAMGGNRIELLAVEAQEERALLLGSFFMAMVIGALCLLGGGAFTAAVVLLLWETSHAGVLLALCACYLAVAALIWWRLHAKLKRWHMFSATIDQLRKDRESLEEVFK